MNEKELLQAISQMMDVKLTPINDRLEKIEERTSKIEERTSKIEERTLKIEERTLKLEVTLENETNKNIQLLMEAQSLNAEKMRNLDCVLDDIESSVVATEAIVRQNIRDINVLKRKAQ